MKLYGRNALAARNRLQSMLQMKEADCVIGALKMSGLIIGAKTITFHQGRGA
jgi:hypothetical protein